MERKAFTTQIFNRVATLISDVYVVEHKSRKNNFKKIYCATFETKSNGNSRTYLYKLKHDGTTIVKHATTDLMNTNYKIVRRAKNGEFIGYRDALTFKDK